MKVQEHLNRTDVVADHDEDFLPICQQAVNIAQRRGVPSHFQFKGKVIVVRGSDSIVDLYTKYLKKDKPLTINSPINDMVKLNTIEGGSVNGDEVKNHQRGYQT